MLTSNQKIAFASILIEMANADGNIDIHECFVIQRIREKLSIDDETFMLAKDVTLPVALAVMQNATEESKVLLAKMLVEVIDADNKVDNAELQLLKVVAKSLGLEIFFG